MCEKRTGKVYARSTHYVGLRLIIIGCIPSRKRPSGADLAAHGRVSNQHCSGPSTNRSTGYLEQQRTKPPIASIHLGTGCHPRRLFLRPCSCAYLQNSRFSTGHYAENEPGPHVSVQRRPQTKHPTTEKLDVDFT